MSIVDAFKAWEHHFPPCDDDDDREIQSRMKDFVAKVIDEIRPQNRQRKEVVEQPRGCALVLIGKRVVQEGKHEGKLTTIQRRCTVCASEKVRDKQNKATRTAYKCRNVELHYAPHTNRGVLPAIARFIWIFSACLCW